MTSKRVNIILAVVVLLSLRLSAQFRHSTQLDPVKETGFYSIGITPELASYLKTDLSDLRIVDDNKQWVPFIVEWPFEKRAIASVLYHLKITNKRTEDFKTILIIENPGKTELSNLILELKNAAAERVGSLSGSDNANDWYVILDSLLIQHAEKYSDTSHHQQINFPSSTYKYFKLTVYNNKREPLNILSALSSAKAESLLKTIPRFFKNPQPKYFQADSSNYSLVTIMFERPFQTGMIQINVARPWLYKRPVKIFSAINHNIQATWVEPGLHAMTISSDDFSGYNTPLLKSDTLFIIIENGDNPPLQISSVTTSLPNRNIIAHLEKGKTYSLLLDDPGATAPVYDLEHFKDRISAPVSLSFSKIKTLQPDAVKAQTQNGKRWIWPVIIFVVISLILLTWKLAADMKKANVQ